MRVRACAAFLLAIGSAAGCAREPGPPVIDAIEPAAGVEGVPFAVTITGQFFVDASASFSDESGSRLSTAFSGAVGEVALEDVVYVSYRELTATVPGTLPEGVYSLSIEDPAGRVTTEDDMVTIGARPLRLAIEDASGGAGAPIGDRSLLVGLSLEAHAVTRTVDGGAFVEDVSVAWAVNGDVGTLDVTQGSRAVLTATTPGLGTLVASLSGYDDATSGTITVSGCTLDAECADPCRSTNACVGGGCVVGPIDLDGDGDGLIAGACTGGTDCDDGNAFCTTDCTDADRDGACVTHDCDDSLATGSDCTDTCTDFFTDADGDGYGDPATAVTACTMAPGTVTDGTDCADRPGADPACNGLPGSACNPGITSDPCDGADNDCDPVTADGSAEPGLGNPCDGPDLDACDEGVLACDGVSVVCSDQTGDAPELCNGADDDCDPGTPDGSGEATLGDACDGTDADRCADGIVACNGVSLACTDDATSAADVCNGLDDDCDPSTPDGSAEVGFGDPCDGPDPGSCLDGTIACDGLALGCNDATGNDVEACNGLDDDCSGTPDDMSQAAIDANCDLQTSGSFVAVWSCPGACTIVDCEPDHWDADTQSSTGCEYACVQSNAGVETCDLADNDCNRTDDDVVDPNADCDALLGSPPDVQLWACQTGACVIVECVPGTVDADTTASTGCELACTETNGGVEICDGLDNDCNGAPDDAPPGATGCTDFYRDDDGDGFGQDAGSQCLCAPAAPHTAVVDGDCDDSPTGCGAACNPGVAGDTCDGVDNDCDAATADGSVDATFGDPCDGPDSDFCDEGFVVCDGVSLGCDDRSGDPVELCNGSDDDCDPSTADGSGEAGFGTACDGDDTDLCDEGVVACDGLAPYCDDSSSDDLDVCNGLDDDCDVASADGDEDSLLGTACEGADGDLCLDDTYVGCTGALLVCSLGAGNLDVCNGLNDDCDGASADGADDPLLGTACDGADGDLCLDDVYVGCTGGLLDCSLGPSNLDVCNGLNDDCDGTSADGAEDPLVGTACDGADSDLCTDDLYNGCSAAALTCSLGAGTTEGPDGDPTCADLADNDCDGSFDGADPDCAGPACVPGSTGLSSPTLQAADTGGDGNGFEASPTLAFADGGGEAGNANGSGDRHRYYGYGLSIPSSCDSIDGIEVRLDWRLDSATGTNNMAVQLSGDSGVTWTALKADTVSSTTERSVILGGASDAWGKTWTPGNFTDVSFRVRIVSTSDFANRDFFLDWVPIRVHYSFLDADSDGIADRRDNCPFVANALQENGDADPYGDACDCEPLDGTIHPGATEGPPGDATCSDGLDNDCNGPIDGADVGCGGAGRLCARATWADVNAGTLQFTPIASVLDPEPRGRTFAQGNWSTSVLGQLAGFSSTGAGGVVVGVQAALAAYISGTFNDDVIRVRTLVGGVPQGSPAEVSAPVLSTIRGAQQAAIVLADVSGQRAWRWSDFDDPSLVLEVTNVATGSAESASVFYDAIGYRIEYSCNSPPAASATVSPLAGTPSTSFTVDASSSTDLEDDVAGIPLEVAWDWEEDGVVDTAFSTTLVASHSFATPGFYSITAHVRDSVGNVRYATAVAGVVAAASTQLVVTTPTDESVSPGTGVSLREAITIANGTAGRDTITFAGPMTIVVDPGFGQLPAITDDVYIIGDGSVTVDGSVGTSGLEHCVQVSGGNAVIAGLELRDCASAGVQFTLGGTGVVRDCYIHGVGGHGVALSSSAQVGPGNRITNNATDGVFVSTTGSLITGNRIYDNLGPGVRYLVGVSGTTVVGNEITGNTGAGIDAADEQPTFVRHNTIAGNTGTGMLLHAATTTASFAQNNIFVGNGGWGLDTQGGSFSGDGNLFARNALGACNACPAMLNAVYLDPSFVDEAGGDYTLDGTSPAIDGGLNLIDVNGPAPGNYNGAGPDIGAHELE